MNIDSLLNNASPKQRPEKLEIHKWPSGVLKQKTAIILSSIKDDSGLQKMLEDMKHTMMLMGAAGLAAPQVGVPLACFVVRDQERVLKVINPQIIKSTGDTYENEGCLSVPGVFTRINRSASIEVSYMDEDNNPITETLTGLLARAYQHEYDHLQGKMFFDRMTEVQKKSSLKKMKKWTK